ncbi:hypothetical protein ACFO4O_09230 [Glaciecola siphonariae]|uniref:Uncharacterized protein n=1 Tax=Glaciecola siphonariae TaxID=521012 RepID=A0ABV9LUZ2_9ALTE
MFWEVFFWLNTALLVLPFPFKVYGYVKGTDTSPRKVKIEEMGNAIFMALGLIPFFGFISEKSVGPLYLWKIWLIIAVGLSILSIFRSPKLSYAKEKIGKTQTVIVSIFSSLFFLPMLVAVYFYAY